MKQVHVKCPYCGARAFLRPASAIYGAKAVDPDASYYVCSRYPSCDSYVAAHKSSRLPMGTLANAELRRQRVLAHVAFKRLWERRNCPLSHWIWRARRTAGPRLSRSRLSQMVQTGSLGTGPPPSCCQTASGGTAV